MSLICHQAPGPPTWRLVRWRLMETTARTAVVALCTPPRLRWQWALWTVILPTPVLLPTPVPPHTGHHLVCLHISSSNPWPQTVPHPPPCTPSMSPYSLEQSYIHHNGRDSSDISVGLSRYSSPSSPVCDRKDFFLNFNGISSFHPATASGSYYHQLHHHHQSVCQDVKPCIM